MKIAIIKVEKANGQIMFRKMELKGVSCHDWHVIEKEFNELMKNAVHYEVYQSVGHQKFDKEGKDITPFELIASK